MPIRIAACVLVSLVLAAPAAGKDAPPSELWSEFPLGQTEPEQQSEPTPAAPAPPAPAPAAPAPAPAAPAPPRDPSEAIPRTDVAPPAGDDGLAWQLPVALGILGAAVVAWLVWRRRSAGATRVAGPSGLQESWRRVLRLVLVPRRVRHLSFVDLEPPGRARRLPCVVRREGIVRTRFVAEIEPRSGSRRQIASSKPFWGVGAAGGDPSNRGAVTAWDGLIDELESDGWELVPGWGAESNERTRSGDSWYEVQLVRTSRPPTEPSAAVDASANTQPTAKAAGARRAS